MIFWFSSPLIVLVYDVRDRCGSCAIFYTHGGLQKSIKKSAISTSGLGANRKNRFFVRSFLNQKIVDNFSLNFARTSTWESSSGLQNFKKSDEQNRRKWIFSYLFQKWRKYRKIVINSRDGPESSTCLCGPRYTVAIIPYRNTDPGPPPVRNFGGSKFSPKTTFYFDRFVIKIPEINFP